jgi:hypothetical protein
VGVPHFTQGAAAKAPEEAGQKPPESDDDIR